MAWLWLAPHEPDSMSHSIVSTLSWGEADGKEMGQNFAEYNKLLGQLNMQKVSRVEAEAKTQGISLLKIKF